MKRVRESVVAHHALYESAADFRAAETRGEEASERSMRDAMARLKRD